MLKAVIFDFDGVVVDSEPLHYRAFMETLEPYGIAWSWDDYCRRVIGYDDRDAFEFFFNDLGKPLDAGLRAELMQRKATIFESFLHDGLAAPIPGSLELIRSLHGRVDMAICSGAVKSDIQPVLLAHDLTTHFKAIITAEDVARSKPDPLCYELTCANLGLTQDAKANTIVIEDTPTGIRAARSAGLPVLAVATTHRLSDLSEATWMREGMTGISRDGLESLLTSIHES